MATDDDLSRIVWCCLSGKHKMKSCEQARFGFYILSWMVGVEVVGQWKILMEIIFGSLPRL